MADYGLLAGIGEGLRSGIESYRQERDYQGRLAASAKAEEDERKKRQFENALRMKQLGILESEDGLQFSPEQEKIRAMDRAKDSAGLLRAGYKPEYRPEQKEYELTPIEGFLTPKQKEEAITERETVRAGRAEQSRQWKEKTQQQGLVSKAATELRREYISNPTVKDTAATEIAFEKMKNSARSGTAAGDMSLIFSYMKMLDPGSTVREGEYASARNAGGVDDKIINAYNQARSGELLNTDQRKDFLNQAQNIYSAQLIKKQNIDKQYTELAKRTGADPRNVVLFEQQQEPRQEIDSSVPKIGQEVEGFVFLGGDPSDQKNWRQK